MFHETRTLEKKYKYCDDDVYKDDAYQALSSQFENRLDFESFYSSLNDHETKDEFLRVGSSYLFFVKNGDWHVHGTRSNSLIDYFTNSFKLVALLAIIESLSDKKNVDFFFWLSEKAKDQKDLFPIIDRSQLQNLYDDYKKEYGSIRRCKSFFANLSPATKENLCNSIKVDGKSESIEKVAERIYQVRSGFAHEIDATLEISNFKCFSSEGNKKVVWELSMKLLQSSFEEGVVAHFKSTSH
jgi:hypothetical protein